MGDLENQQNQEKTSPALSWTFGRVVQTFLIADAAMILFLTLGFIMPSKPVYDRQTGALPEQYYDYSAKASPFAPPAPEPVRAKVTVEKITARGDHPTFVPVPAPGSETMNASVADSPAAYGDTAVYPTHASYAQPASDSVDSSASPIGVRARARELPAVIQMPRRIPRPAVSEPPAAPAGVRVETIDTRRSTS